MVKLRRAHELRVHKPAFVDVRQPVVGLRLALRRGAEPLRGPEQGRHHRPEHVRVHHEARQADGCLRGPAPGVRRQVQQHVRGHRGPEGQVANSREGAHQDKDEGEGWDQHPAEEPPWVLVIPAQLRVVLWYAHLENNRKDEVAHTCESTRCYPDSADSLSYATRAQGEEEHEEKVHIRTDSYGRGVRQEGQVGPAEGKADQRTQQDPGPPVRHVLAARGHQRRHSVPRDDHVAHKCPKVGDVHGNIPDRGEGRQRGRRLAEQHAQVVHAVAFLARCPQPLAMFVIPSLRAAPAVDRVHDDHHGPDVGQQDEAGDGVGHRE
mmetsp:Transcript_126519/g.369684  ORF Transcript_126519/g.369684 Transcript_126519/m.369684 type:complete len:321 (+) Transcript_126519:908-1870(+)